MNQLAALTAFEFRKITGRKIVGIAGGIMLLLCVFLSISDLISYTAYSQSRESESSGWELMKTYQQNARALSGEKIDAALLQDMRQSFSREETSSEASLHIIDSSTGSQTVIESGGDTEDDTDSDILAYTPIDTYLSRIVADDAERRHISAGDFYQERNTMISDNRRDQQLEQGELEYWQQKDSQLSVPFIYEYNDGWSNLWEYATTLNFMLLLFLTICLSSLFSTEYTRRTDAVILCCRYGRRHLFLAKLLAGILFGLAAAILLFGVTLLCSLGIYGTDGFHSTLQVAFPLATRTLPLGTSVGLLFLLFLILAILYSAGILFLSETLKNSIAVMAIPVSIMILSTLIDIPYQFRTASQIFDFLPTNLFAVWELWDDRLISIFGNYVTNFQFAPLVYLLAAVLLILLTERSYRKYQVTGR